MEKKWKHNQKERTTDLQMEKKEEERDMGTGAKIGQQFQGKQVKSGRLLKQ